MNEIGARYCWRCGARLTEPPLDPAESRGGESSRILLVFPAEHAGDANGAPD